jgi:hypothetical protein
MARVSAREIQTTIYDLLDIESIKHQRALGSKYLDSGDLEALVDLYTEDAVCEFGPYGSWHGRDTFLTNFAEAEAPFEAEPQLRVAQRMLNDGFLNQHASSSHLTRLTTEPFRAVSHSHGDSTTALSPDRMADLEDICALSARYARGLDRFAMDELLEPFAGESY